MTEIGLTNCESGVEAVGYLEVDTVKGSQLASS